MGRRSPGWGATGSAEGWVIDDGSILCTVQGGKYLYTEEHYDNFILALDLQNRVEGQQRNFCPMGGLGRRSSERA